MIHTDAEKFHLQRAANTIKKTLKEVVDMDQQMQHEFRSKNTFVIVCSEENTESQSSINEQSNYESGNLTYLPYF